MSQREVKMTVTPYVEFLLRRFPELSTRIALLSAAGAPIPNELIDEFEQVKTDLAIYFYSRAWA